LRALAICCSVVAPAFFTCFMIGSTVPAKRSASALPASPPLPRMASRFGLPSFTPRALAAASAALVRCEISVRSCQVWRRLLTRSAIALSGPQTVNHRWIDPLGESTWHQLDLGLPSMNSRVREFQFDLVQTGPGRNHHRNPRLVD
jgi:hypothetical protein